MSWVTLWHKKRLAIFRKFFIYNVLADFIYLIIIQESIKQDNTIHKHLLEAIWFPW